MPSSSGYDFLPYHALSQIRKNITWLCEIFFTLQRLSLTVCIIWLLLQRRWSNATDKVSERSRVSVVVQRASMPGVTMPRIDQCAQFTAKLLYIGAHCGHLLTRGANCTHTKKDRFTNHNLVSYVFKIWRTIMNNTVHTSTSAQCAVFLGKIFYWEMRS